jgi:hypothetical protein
VPVVVATVLCIAAAAALGGLIGWAVVNAFEGSPDADAGTTSDSTVATGGAVLTAVPSDLEDRWLTIVGTFQGEETPERMAASVTEMAGRGLDVDALRTDALASLEPGLWVLVESDWPTPDEAVERCVELGLEDRSRCFARLASQDEADRQEVRFPD